MTSSNTLHWRTKPTCKNRFYLKIPNMILNVLVRAAFPDTSSCTGNTEGCRRPNQISIFPKSPCYPSGPVHWKRHNWSEHFRLWKFQCKNAKICVCYIFCSYQHVIDQITQRSVGGHVVERICRFKWLVNRVIDYCWRQRVKTSHVCDFSIFLHGKLDINFLILNQTKILTSTTYELITFSRGKNQWLHSSTSKIGAKSNFFK